MTRVTALSVSISFDEGAPPCCCGESEPPGSDCARLGDTLHLHIAYCGREWTSTLRFKNEVFGYRVWQTQCDLGWVADCPGWFPFSQNGQICAVFECLPGEAEEYRLTFGTGCTGTGDCVNAGMPQITPISVQLDPFEVVFGTAFPGANWCDDDPPCFEAAYITVTIP